MAPTSAVTYPNRRNARGTVSLTMRIGPAADELLHLDEAEVGLDTGGVAVEHEADGAGRGGDGGLSVAHAVLTGRRARGVPDLVGGIEQLGRRRRGVDAFERAPVHVEHLQHRFAVGGEPGERPHPRREAAEVP